jgi:polyisoprenoid-binding protein YceI
MKKALLFVLLFGLTVASAQTWKSDLSHSRVEFTVTHLMISEVTGRFTQFDATLQQGKEDFTDSKIETTIKTASVSTDNEGRDKHLRSDEFFNAEKFPEMKFTTTSFEKTAKDSYRITGQLTMRDVTKEVVLEAKFLGSLSDPRGTRAGFKATGTINRQDWGVKWNRNLDNGGVVVSDNVIITLLMEFIQQK